MCPPASDSQDPNASARRRERFAAVQAAFHQALDLSQKEREGFLKELEGRDPELHRELRRLLLAEPVAAELMEPAQLAPNAATAAAARESGLIGRRLGQYELLAELGRGSAGIVFRARDVVLDREVALKVLSGPWVSDEMRLRFQGEARVVSRLAHPGIVPVLTAGEDQGMPYFAMELVRGQSLKEHLEARRAARQAGQPLPAGSFDFSEPRQAADLVRRVALALAHAHSRGVMHRDIKPANILIDGAGRPLLADFGLAKAPQSQNLTRTGELFGTPHYMSPEQAQSLRHQIDHRTDIYSLGAVLYELLADRPPPSGDTLQAVLHNIVHERPVPLRSLAPKVPQELVLICMKALRYRPERRYQDANQLAEDLERYLESAPITASRPGLVESLEERLHSRRSILKLVPAVLALGVFSAVGVQQGLGWVERRSKRAKLDLQFDPGEIGNGIEVYARQVDPQNGWTFLPPVRLARFHSARAELFLEPGFTRLIFINSEQRWCEYSAQFGVQQTTRLKPRLLASPATDAGMVSIPGGRVNIELWNQGPGVGAPPTQVLDLPGFRLDRACVSLREFQQFVVASDGFDRLPSELSALLKTQLDPTLADLPAAGVPLDVMRDYACSMGKRLPTAAEWQTAMGGPDAAWFAEGEVLSNTESFVLVPAGEPTPDTSGLEEFKKRARPVLESGPGQGPYGLSRGIGNVAQITEIPPTWQMITSGPNQSEVAPQESCYLVGFSWNATREMAAQALWLPIPVASWQGNWSIGWRCASSLDPLG